MRRPKISVSLLGVVWLLCANARQKTGCDQPNHYEEPPMLPAHRICLRDSESQKLHVALFGFPRLHVFSCVALGNLFLLEDFFCDVDGVHGVRPATVERQMSDGLDQFLLRHAVCGRSHTSPCSTSSVSSASLGAKSPIGP